MMRGMIGLALAGTALACMPAGAATFSATYVFGDSLSDRGNVADAVGHPLPNPPFYHDSFTNGDVAVEVMAERFGLTANASLFPPGPADPLNTNFATGGTNYAFSGATAGSTFGQGQPGTNLGQQLGAYLLKSGGLADANALYTVFIGGNDVRKATSANSATYITDGVTAEVSAIQSLLTAGARHLLVVNVPDIGRIPEYALYTPGSVEAANAFTNSYNSQLTGLLAPITAANASARIYQFDLFSYNAMLLANPSSIGVTDTVDPCYISYGEVTNNNPLVVNPLCGTTNGGTTQASNIGNFYFWDAIHPTAKVQAALGNSLYDFVQASEAPEPASWAMMITGFAMTGMALRRRSTAAPALA